MKVLTVALAVVEGDRELTAPGDNHFYTLLMSVPSATFAGGHVVCPINTLDVERHIFHLLSHSKITPWVANLWQLDYIS